MSERAPRNQGIAIAAVLSIGLVLAAAILAFGGREAGHSERGGVHAETEPNRGRQGESGVAMTDAQLAASGVELAIAGPATIASTSTFLGEVRYDRDRTVQVVPRLSGLVESVRVSAGDRVTKGQVLAVLKSQALADQRADLLNARRRLALAQATHARERQLWEQKISAEQDLQQARAALDEAEVIARSAQQKLVSLGASYGNDLTRFELRAPIDGVVTEKRISVGEVVKDDAGIFTVSDLSTVWVESAVPASMLGTLRVGQAARIRANAFDAEAVGEVRNISPLVGVETRTAVARIVVSNATGAWRPGLPVTVDITTATRQAAIAIRVDAIQEVGDRKVVFGRVGNGFESRPLTLGQSDGRAVEVLGGLAAGERYAAKNSFLVKAELGKSGADHGH